MTDPALNRQKYEWRRFGVFIGRTMQSVLSRQGCCLSFGKTRGEGKIGGSMIAESPFICVGVTKGTA